MVFCGLSQILYCIGVWTEGIPVFGSGTYNWTVFCVATVVVCQCRYVISMKQFLLTGSVSDPHWFRCGSGYGSVFSLFSQCGIRIQGAKPNADPDLNPDPGQT